ncbi:MAG: hypothetical protein ACLQGV_01585 [Bryobacteraceae bacterium]
MSRTGRRAGFLVGAVSRFSMLLLLLAVYAPATRAQGNTPAPSTFMGGDCAGWFLCTEAFPSSYTGSVTVPKEGKFIVLDRVEYALVDWENYWGGNLSQSFYSITVTAPGGAQVMDPIYEIRRPIDQLPTGGPPWILDWTGLDFENYYRRITTVVDVSTYTATGPVQLTISYQSDYANNGWGLPGISARFALYGASGFLLTQTPYTFQPRDFRDGGADGEHVGSASPSGPDIAQCKTNLSDCRPTFVAFVTGMGNRPNPQFQHNGLPDPLSTPPYGGIDFYLSLPAYQTAWLPGNSTNNGADTDPDYVFCGLLDQPQPVRLLAPDQGGLHINLPAPGPVNQVNVCSHDYGGVAILRATLSIAGTPLEAQIIERNTLMTPVSPPPPSCAGTGQFASLPVDQDCNGIADSWEAQYKSAPGYSAIPPGATTNATGDNDLGGKQPGDRLTNFEEYRGFHYVTDDWSETSPDPSKIRWIRTDPVNSLDVFFWDSTPDGWVTKALKNGPGDTPPGILALQTPAITYRRVNAAQAHAVDPSDPTQGVSPLNGKAANAPGLKPYAIAYFDFTQPDYEEDPPCQGWNDVLGSGGAYTDPITLYSVDIKQCVARFNNVISEGVLRAWAVAHETGHLLGLQHYYRQATYVATIPPPSRTEYSLSSTLLDLYTRSQVYQPSEVVPPGSQPQATWELSDELAWADVAAVLPGCGLTGDQLTLDDPPSAASYYFYPPGTAPEPGAADYPVVYHMKYPVPLSTNVCIQETRDEIMDYFPRFVPANGTAGNWKFSPANPDDLKNICLTCPGQN